MKHIISVTNPEIKKIVLLHDKKGRLSQGLFIVEGLKNIQAFIDAKWMPWALYVTEKNLAALQATIGDYEITVVAEVVMKKMSASVTPSGALGIFALPAKKDMRLAPGSLVLAGIGDPGNMGTLIRTAAALQSPSVLIIDGADPFSPKVVQAATGAHALVPISTIDWNTLIKEKNTAKLCALVVAGGKEPQELDLKKSILIVGSEAHGIPQQWIRQCDQLMTLPMPGKTESLNAAVAGSLALYERYRMLR